ncbi:MAG: hypothetical protein R3F59_28035 [Myxococcota bacterium]
MAEPDRLAALLEGLARADAPDTGPALVGTVAGSARARDAWARRLPDLARAVGAGAGASLWEDRPTNQALGLLLLWERVRAGVPPGAGALFAFAIGEGTRAAPFTQAEGGEKGALASYRGGARGRDDAPTWLEVALWAFAPVEAHLRRSGFDGLVVKWGDEVLLPGRALPPDPALADADVVRFVSVRPITAEAAASKDWLAVGADGRITAFLPRRPLAAFEALAAAGRIRRSPAGPVAGVNLGSIAVSRGLLDVLVEAFGGDLADLGADPRRRPDLDPQLFTALTVAALDDPAARADAWAQAMAEVPAVRAVDGWMPDLVRRLRAALDRLADRRGRAVRFVALDLGDPWWADLGDQRGIRAALMQLRAPGPDGTVARALARIPEAADAHGNRFAGDCRIAPGVRVRGSVLVDAHLQAGEVVDSVLVGTRAGHVDAHGAFDVDSAACRLSLGRGAGAYKLLADVAAVGPGERLTTLVTADGLLPLRGAEGLDLRDRAASWDVPVLGNRVSLREAQGLADPGRRASAREAVLRVIGGSPA